TTTRTRGRSSATAEPHRCHKHSIFGRFISIDEIRPNVRVQGRPPARPGFVYVSARGVDPFPERRGTAPGNRCNYNDLHPVVPGPDKNPTQCVMTPGSICL